MAATELATTAAVCGACRDAGDLVKNLAATREVRRPRQRSGRERHARGAFLHDADDPRGALHLQIRATSAGSGRLAVLAGDGGGVGWRQWRLTVAAGRWWRWWWLLTVAAGEWWLWRWRWRLATVAPVAAVVGKAITWG
uniref:Uncharacterized protein n=1 Tax=Oryza meridionalis TaxID=40149 RepID=A0A0E0D4E5_9ORYZ